MTHQPIPKFAAEEEEASWWDAHPEVLAERFQTARQQGKLRRLSQTSLARRFRNGHHSHRPRGTYTRARPSR